MGERRASMMERILGKVEERVEEYRAQKSGRETQMEAHRVALWAEAAERQRLLLEAVSEEESDRSTLEEITRSQRVVFVLHRTELGSTLEAFAGERDRLVNVVPGKGAFGGGQGIEGLRGSWLVFETPG